ncbi:MAG: hypothetical protein OZSIB_0686 [Candidatus Ozemobacter sibiricus]|jgi:type II secretory pathway component PulJ|uniref:Prepilin-type N-terminal cleavage/methylation domain-containing protein n=1 Tax=Candidatus Ozemobacter sibiricus TaxID=2268124 RepID=A0A367ZW18_9BACT|nr:MAG: hypothetical protein OZSIB_0686 [Candidatus Ozemobacter sibiricus]
MPLVWRGAANADSGSRGRPGARPHRGFTLVEAVIGMMLAATLLAICYRIFTHINRQRALGSVDLQELQGARFAINHLRRDFRSAVPRIARTASLAQKERAVRNPAVEARSYNRSPDVVPIVVAEGEIHFFRQVFDTPETTASPILEEVNYRIDPTRKCLVRTSAGKEQVFPTIRGARFELYGHPLAAEIPMLLVTLVIEATNKEGAGTTEMLEMTTTISSTVAAQNINQPSWHRVYY